MGGTFFAYSVQGSSHVQKENEPYLNGMKRRFPCQDRSFSDIFEPCQIEIKKDRSFFTKDRSSTEVCKKVPIIFQKHDTKFTLLAASDGHGSAPYFRSGQGAEYAIVSLIELLTSSIDKLVSCYELRDFSQIEEGISKGIAQNRWIEKISNHLLENPITETEYDLLSMEDESRAETYKKEYLKFADIKTTDAQAMLKFMRESVLKEIYGCTLVAFIQTPSFWYALQIGDGDLAISYDGLNYKKPIPEDPNCIGNETTSLCGNKSYSDFRFAHGERVPKVVFCSTDGISNSVSGDDGLFELYKWFFSRFYDEEYEDCKNCKKNIDENNYFCDFANCRIKLTKKKIFDGLYDLSKRGSGDDISLVSFMTFSPEDISKIKKYTYYRRAKFLEQYDVNKSKVFFNESISLGNPFAIYELAKKILK